MNQKDNYGKKYTLDHYGNRRHHKINLIFYRNRGEHSERKYIFLTIIIAVLIMAYYFINGKYVGYN